MPPKKGAEKEPSREKTPEITVTSTILTGEDEVEIGTDFFRYVQNPSVTYEGSYETLEDEGGTEKVLFRHGNFGRYTNTDVTCEGSWHKDVLFGSCKVQYPSGATYQGECVEGQYHGIGKYTWADGSWYQGNWFHNRFHGEGEYHDKKGQHWKGKYYNNEGPGIVPIS
mmetsp:Transcript_13475/g.18460  ORF Transcript_13475/g.18460 Transcript_13475/m.18460 type:complete len:168 (-) Transcript_13475:124-627(-)